MFSPLPRYIVLRVGSAVLKSQAPSKHSLKAGDPKAFHGVPASRGAVSLYSQNPTVRCGADFSI